MTIICTPWTRKKCLYQEKKKHLISLTQNTLTVPYHPQIIVLIMDLCTDSVTNVNFNI